MGGFESFLHQGLIRKGGGVVRPLLVALALASAWGGAVEAKAEAERDPANSTDQRLLRLNPRDPGGAPDAPPAGQQLLEYRPPGLLDKLDLSGPAESARWALTGIANAMRGGADQAWAWWQGDDLRVPPTDGSLPMEDLTLLTSTVEGPTPWDVAAPRHQAVPPYSPDLTWQVVVTAAWAELEGASRIFHWTAPDGVHYRAKVGDAQYRQYATAQQERIDAARAELRAETEDLIEGRLRPALTEAEEGIGDYGDWIYDWWTAWILLGQTLGWTWQGILDGKFFDIPNVVHARLIEEIRRQYDDIVLRRESLELEMRAFIDRVAAAVQRRIMLMCGPMADARRDFIRTKVQEIEQLELGEGWVAWEGEDRTVSIPAPNCGAYESDDQVVLVAVLLEDRTMSDQDAGVDEVIVRLSRPFATKLISFMVLPVAATAVAGGIAVPFIGLPAGAAAGLLAGGAVGAVVVGFSTSAAVDWLLTRADEALSREAFEVQLRDAVKDATEGFEIRVANTMGQFVERQLNVVAVDAFGLEPQ